MNKQLTHYYHAMNILLTNHYNYMTKLLIINNL